jgi:hypothetical protein
MWLLLMAERRKDKNEAKVFQAVLNFHWTR